MGFRILKILHRRQNLTSYLPNWMNELPIQSSLNKWYMTVFTCLFAKMAVIANVHRFLYLVASQLQLSKSKLLPKENANHAISNKLAIFIVLRNLMLLFTSFCCLVTSLTNVPYFCNFGNFCRKEFRKEAWRRKKVSNFN